MKTTKAFDWTLRARVHHTFVCTRTQQLNSRSPYRGRVWHPAPCSEAAAAWYREGMRQPASAYASIMSRHSISSTRHYTEAPILKRNRGSV